MRTIENSFMNFLCVAALLMVDPQVSAGVIYEQCFMKEKSKAVLDMAKESITMAKDLLPECDGGANKTECGLKEQTAAYIEAALELIEDAKKYYPDCNGEVITEPEPPTEPPTQPTTTPTTQPTTEPTTVPTTEPTTVPTTTPEPLPSDCLDVKQKGQRANGVYTIQLAHKEANNKKMDVYCDMETDGGGWTVIQRRDDYAVQEDFYRGWADYKNGFGKITKDFWIGNENIYYLSNVGKSEARFDMQGHDLQSRYAQYSNFRTDGEDNLFKLFINDYRGNAGDSLKYNNLKFFITKDKTFDFSNNGHCTSDGQSGWWFDNCGYCNFNGLYSRTRSCRAGNRFIHVHYHQWKECEPLKFTEIKIRRKQ